MKPLLILGVVLAVPAASFAQFSSRTISPVAPGSVSRAPAQTLNRVPTLSPGNAAGTRDSRGNIRQAPTIGFGGSAANPAADDRSFTFQNGSRINAGGVAAGRDYRGSPGRGFAEASRDWDHRHEQMWNNRRYRWSGGNWIVIPASPYGYGYYSGGAYGSSSTLNDDVGLSTAPPSVYVAPLAPAEEEIETSSLTVDVQRGLARLGYYRGPIDGILGPGTRSAIASFQAANGLDQNGRITQEVVSTLGL